MSRLEASARLKIRDGKLEGFKRQAAELIRLTREKDTGTLRYDWFISRDGTECEVREAYVDSDALLQHNMHVREARDVLFAEFAYDHEMAFFGDASPQLVQLAAEMGVDVGWYSFFQGLEPAQVG